MKHWRQILPGLVALALAPALYAANPCATGGAPIMRDGTGQGGTGAYPGGMDGTGQGGTGLTSGKKFDGDGSGTGGTGLRVEVEGTITGFASICVNGLELHYSPATPVLLHGRAATPDALAIGQVVRALAQGTGDQLTLQHVQVRHLLIAPVQGLSSGGLRAQGRAISLSPQAVLPVGLAPGVKVAVSGFIGANGHSIATRLDIVPVSTPDSLTGEVQRNAQGELTVDGVTLEGRLPRLEPGDVVRAEGHYAQGRMQITRIEREVHERGQPVDRVVIQGPVRHADKSGLSIGSQRFLIDSQTRIKQTLPRAGEWAKIDAVREGRQFHAREVDALARPGSHLDKPASREDGSARRADHDEEKSAEYKQAHPSSMNSERPHRDVERSERSERSEAPEKIERQEKIEKPEKVEKPEKIERAEKIERIEKVERPEHPEHDD